jgi:hypothetical protein
MAKSSTFSRLMEEYGSLEKEEEEVAEADAAVAEKVDATPDDAHKGQDDKKAAKTHLMQEEERETGAVTFKVYSRYFRFAGSILWAPAILTLLMMSQGAQGKLHTTDCQRQITDAARVVGNNLFLGFWTDESIHGFTQGDYMALYASLGVATAVLTFGVSLVIA